MNCEACDIQLPDAYNLVLCSVCEPIATRVMNTCAMESTGNAEQDEAHMRSHAISTARIERGLCPNGCGPLTIWPGHKECRKCRFTYYQRTL